ncbi:MAG: peptide-methionine (S)-S-oxide reductase MsrA [Opitutales bacterium]|nr:peptide-methionine (S)-S-oxide reductase MsrA [Opitutales bacterium]
MKQLFSTLIFALAMTPASPSDAESSPTYIELVLGGGCFWCVEAVYERFEGVQEVHSGYAGGHVPDPSYQDVISGRTGHAEVVRIRFDPEQVSLEDLLDFFWVAHDPTTLNRQGADVGTQYRSIILYAGEDQKAAALASMERAQEGFSRPIVTEIGPLEAFYLAEDYHQDYFANNPEAAYCQYVIAPKIQQLKAKGKITPAN